MKHADVLAGNACYDPRFEHDACGVGAIVNINGHREHTIIELGKRVLMNLEHRGASGADPLTGDGAGILIHIPHDLLVREVASDGIDLPPAGEYGVAMVFLPKTEKLATGCEQLMARSLTHYGLSALGWRTVPTNADCLGDVARSSEPLIRQCIIAAGEHRDDELERRLYMARKRAERLVRDRYGEKAADFYVCSMSARTLIYKGMFLAPQLFDYFPDLAREEATTALAVVHQRYSTNTLPNWQLAQPFRMVAHNGEINTLSGNANWLAAREPHMKADVFGDNISDLFPVLDATGSDSACFDSALELLVQAGRSLPHAMMMMIPEAFGNRYHMSTDKRAFYEYHSSIMEPWDGPAAMVFTDGRIIGGTLDRNGLRPARYIITSDGLLVLASEVGVVDLPAGNIVRKGRLKPGRMFLVDILDGRIVGDSEIKGKVSRSQPYRRWLSKNRIELRGLFGAAPAVNSNPATIARRMRTFGYTREELKRVMAPMALNGQEAIGSMGTDTPLAVLSDRPRLLFDYFKQLFAQVTNPPIDPLREGLVMSLMSFTGKKRNILTETEEHCRQLKLPHPILTAGDVELLTTVKRNDFKVAIIPALFDANEKEPGAALEQGIAEMISRAEMEIRDGASLLIASDRDMSQERIPIPSLLVASALHHGLLARRLRAGAGIVVESGEPREVMHFCLLCGFGANAVHPYLAFEVIDELRRRGDLPEEMEGEQLADNFINAIKKGILKTMSKMGISTLRSYRAAQLFEAIGLDHRVIDQYFPGTASRVEGIGLETIADEALQRCRKAYADRSPAALDLDYGGEYHVRHDGEFHQWNAETVSLLQHAVRSGSAETYAEFSRVVNDRSKKLATLRGLLEFVPGNPVPLEEVEPAEEIVKRFCTGAMSHGSISAEAHETMAVAMNQIGAMSNTGEGGEDPKRYKTNGDGLSRSAGIKQIASGRFGVTAEYLAQAKWLQIKMAQGAKPGEGGQLPGHKVTAEIAALRHSTVGVSLISPPPHHDIYSIEDLAQLIYDLKCGNPDALISVKLVSEVGVGTIAAGVAKAKSDEILISGHDGGTGASPLSSIKHTGAPWEVGIAETQQTLIINNLRDRVRLQVDGHLKTGRDVVIGALLGAERFGFGTGALVSLGCVLMRKCHHGNCPVGIATQDPELRKRFAGKPEHLQRYLLFIAEEVREIMARLGFRKMDEMIGRTDRLKHQPAVNHWKANGVDLSRLFAAVDVDSPDKCRYQSPQPRLIDDHIDWQWIEEIHPAIDDGKNVTIERDIRNVDRSIGTVLSHHLVTKFGAGGLPDDTIRLKLQGSAGQSLGAFLMPGVTIQLTGDSNDYVGKGLSGGRIVIRTPSECHFEQHENTIAGNTLLYGATAGEAFINGRVGERFAVRNSGAVAVVEGVGDHACEYMTGGTVVVLGQTGRNFAAGMSGGLAYVLDEHQWFDTLCNLDMVDLEPMRESRDLDQLHDLVTRHYNWTQSRQARRILDAWREMTGKFVKVVPIEYRKALQRLREAEDARADSMAATEEVYDG